MFSRTVLGLIACGAAFATLAAGSAASAFSVQPLLVELEPGAAESIRIENNRSDVLTIEASVLRRNVDENGVQTRTPADDDFIVLPPQMVIPVGGVQVVRIQWVGETSGAESASYYLNLRELPVALDPDSGGAQVQLAFAFDVAVQVAPADARAELALLGSEVATNDAGEPVARLTIENQGSRYTYLQEATYDIEVLDASGSVVARPRPSSDEIIDLLGVTLIEPGKRRIVDFPIADAAGAATVRGRVSAANN